MNESVSVPQASLPLLLAFCRTYEGGSFTRAARALQLRPAAVSRAVAKLEEQVGVPLFRRSTRSLQPTPAGDRFYAAIAPALTALANAEASVAEDGVPRGRVRISAPTTWGLHRLTALLAGFAEAFPSVELDLHIQNHVVDFVREGFDLAIRLGPVEEQSFVARRVEDAPIAVYASPAYLARQGTPATVAALADHRVLPFVLPRAGRHLPWLFANPDEDWTPGGPVRVFDDPIGVIALARAGVGLCQTYRFLVEREVAAGSLVEVLADRSGRSRRFSIVYPRGSLTPAARAVVDYLQRAKG